jgi:hypothetical protein
LQADTVPQADGMPSETPATPAFGTQTDFASLSALLRHFSAGHSGKGKPLQRDLFVTEYQIRMVNVSRGHPVAT